MIEYQNIFTQVQVEGPAEWGMDNENNMAEERMVKPFFSTLIGWIGNAQLGPVNLGMAGVVSLASGLIWLNIIGFNMLAQVGWSRQPVPVRSRRTPPRSPLGAAERWPRWRRRRAA